jgi:hypothetical protein
MRIGRLRRTPHFAHEPGVECPLHGARETLFHYNAVRRLAHELRLRPEVTATIQCTGNERSRCREHITEPLGVVWDETLVEARLPSVGPDILLRKDSRPVLAIEVRATNPVSRDKADAYARSQLPWIEIEARFIHGWTPGEPLVVIEQCGALRTLCDSHAESTRIVATAPAVIPAPRTPAPALGIKWKFRIVDWYPSPHQRIRKLYWMTRAEQAGGWTLRIIDDSEIQPTIIVGPEPVLEKALRRAVEAFKQFLASPGVTGDSPMQWMDASDLPRSTSMYNKSRFPPRFQLVPSSEEWRLDPNHEWARWPADRETTGD